MKREIKSKISKEKILQASLKEFGEKDFSTASVNSICKNNDISKGMLFHYYKNKDELFLMCVEKLFIDLSEYINCNYKISSESIEKNITEFMKQRFVFFENFPCFKQIFFTATFNPPSHLIHEISILRRPIIKVNRDFWYEVVRHLDLKASIDIDEVIEMIIGIGDYLHMKIQGSISKSDFEEMNISDWYSKEYSKMIDMLLYGIVKRNLEE